MEIFKLFNIVLGRLSEPLHGNIPALDSITADAITAIRNRESDVASFTPIGSPGVANEPVGKPRRFIFTFTNDDDCVIQLQISEATGIVENTGIVKLPLTGVSCHSDDNGSSLESSSVGGRTSCSKVGSLTDRVVFRACSFGIAFLFVTNVGIN